MISGAVAAVAAMASLVTLATGAAAAVVPVPTDTALVLGGATADGWAPALLEPLDPWGTTGRLVPLINAHYYDCDGCTATVVSYPRTAGPFFGPCAPFADESIAIGAEAVLTKLRPAQGPSVVSGLSLGAMTADAVQHSLDTEPNGPPPEQVTFIVAADPSRATPLTTGIGAFLPAGFRIPVLGWTVVRPAPDSVYDTVVVVGEYDPVADFPDRPWNLLAVLNAVMSFNYVHSEAALSIPADVPPENVITETNSTGATTTTYLVPTTELPLVKPFAGILPARVIAAATAFLAPIVDRGYSRNDAATGSSAPYLQPTDGLPRLVRHATGASALSRTTAVANPSGRPPAHRPARPAARGR